MQRKLFNVRMLTEIIVSPKRLSWTNLFSDYVFYSNFAKLAILSGQKSLYYGIGDILYSMKKKQLPVKVPDSTFTRDEELKKMYDFSFQVSNGSF